jgi:Fic family protein
MAFNPKYVVTQTTLQNLAKIERIKESFEDSPISPVLMSSLRKSAKLLSVHYSTKIEGNRLTKEEVEAAVLEHKFIPNRERDSSEVKAYYKAMDFVEEALKNGEDLSEEFVQKLHGIVENDPASQYRDGQNAVYDGSSGKIIYMPPEAKDVPFLMSELIDWINNGEETPSVIIAGLAHYQFVTIHPYYDGNGRTARLITSFLMRKFGYGLKDIYSLEEYYANDLFGYYDALAAHPHHNYYEGRENADLTRWIDYFTRGVAETFEKIREQARRQVASDKSSLMRKLDVKQRKILELFVEFEEATSTQIAKYLGLSQQSGRLQANRWIKEGFLNVSNQSKKSRRYKLADQYEAILRNHALSKD